MAGVFRLPHPSAMLNPMAKRVFNTSPPAKAAVWRFEHAQVLDIHDGDTIHALITTDLGFGATYTRKLDIRLLGGNMIELEDPGGPETQAYVEGLLRGRLVTLDSVKDDKFGGRYDARIILADGRDLMQLLISEGWAAPWNGKGPKPVPTWPRVAPPQP